MKYQKFDSENYLLRLEIGDEIMKTLCDFAKDMKIGGAVVSGLGAVKDTTIGAYHLEQKEYTKRIFKDELELASLNGNLSWMNNTPMAHCHITLSDPECRAFAGHLFESTTAVTVELYVRDLKAKIQRKPFPEIGLNLLDLPCAP